MKNTLLFKKIYNAFRWYKTSQQLTSYKYKRNIGLKRVKSMKY